MKAMNNECDLEINYTEDAIYLSRLNDTLFITPEELNEIYENYWAIFGDRD